MDTAQAADIRARDAQIRAWLTAHKTNSYRPEDLPAGLVPPTNEERSAAEVFEFMRDKPDKYFVYVRMDDVCGACATTWMGDELGRGRCGREYRSNMGDKRRSIFFWGINGERYSGTYYCGAGDYARVRKVKSNSRAR